MRLIHNDDASSCVAQGKELIFINYTRKGACEHIVCSGSPFLGLLPARGIEEEEYCRSCIAHFANAYVKGGECGEAAEFAYAEEYETAAGYRAIIWIRRSCEAAPARIQGDFYFKNYDYAETAEGVPMYVLSYELIAQCAGRKFEDKSLADHMGRIFRQRLESEQVPYRRIQAEIRMYRELNRRIVESQKLRMRGECLF